MARPKLTHDLILAAARNHLVSRGVAGLSLRKLAAELDVTAPALYAHFASKDDLVRALAEDEFTRLIHRLEAATGRDPLEVIRAQCRAYVAHAVENPALFQVMFLFRPEWVFQPDAPVLAEASKAFAVGAEPLRQAIEAGLIAEPDPLLASLTLWSAVQGVATVLLARPGLGAPYEQALVDSVIDRVLAGLARPLGS